MNRLRIPLAPLAPLALLALLALGACSSGGNTSAGAAPMVTSVVQPQQLQTATATYDLTSVEDRDVIKTTILAPLDSVWAVLPGVFLELGVDPGTVSQQQHYIANTSFQMRRSLGGVQLSRYVDCGSSVSGAMANQSVVTMSLTVQVVSDSSDVSTLRTQLNAYAFQEGTQGLRMHCGSTGRLEARITKMVNDDLQHRLKK